MAKANSTRAKSSNGTGKALAAALCNVLGTLLLVGVIALCAPLAVPRFAGFEVFEVVSGSMEPEIAIGSAVFVKTAVDPAEVSEGQIIAFNEVDGTVVHRVVTNRTSLGEFVTKGDANNVEDLQPVPYDALIGRVERSVPYLGSFMAVYSTTMGKVYLLLTAACGVMFNVLASRVRASRRRDQQIRALKAAEASRQAIAGYGAPVAYGNVSAGYGTGALGGQALYGAAVPADRAAQTAIAGTQVPYAPEYAAAPRHTANVPASSELAQLIEAEETSPRRRGHALRVALGIVLGAVFLGSSGVVGYVTWQHAESDAAYARAAELYSAKVVATADDIASAALPKPPIQVDFPALLAENPDIVGWIYCEGTPIDYPVLQGETNDQYLHADYTGAYNIDGSIFVDADNSPGFKDGNTIIYGHHMNSGSMFAELVKWADQSFYDQHPIVWLLTPEQNYRLVVFSAHHANAHSTYYNIIPSPGPELDAFLSGAADESDITVSEATAAELVANAAQPTSYGSLRLDSKAHYVMLTTCAYLFDDDRYVLHCLLTPAGGAATT